MKIKENYLYFENQKISFSLKKTHRFKNFTMRFHSQKKNLILNVPTKISEKEIFFLLMENEKWIKSQFKKNLLRKEENLLIFNRDFPYLGENYKLKFIKNQKSNFVYDKKNKIFSFACNEKMIGFYLSKFLKNQAKLLIEPLVKDYSKSCQASYKKISYKDTKSQWGACTKKKNLSFSWRIMMAPENVIHYLVAHEVAHLIEFNHSKAFWNLCEKLCPSFKEQKIWLRKNGSLLQSYSFIEI